MARYSATVRDQNGAPIPGVRVTVTLSSGGIPVLTDDDGDPLAQPLITDEYGGFYFNTATEFYDLAYYYRGRLIQRDYRVPVGDPIEQGPPGPEGPPGEPGYLTFGTWAALSATTGTTANETAIVLGDSGTHTDPVVGGTVANSGRYAWSASPAGWKWNDDYSSNAVTFHAETVQPPTPSTGTSQTLVEFTTPNNPAGQPSPAKVRFSATHNPYAANSQDGIGTHAAYTNKTVGFSVGATATYGKEVSTDAAASMIIEHGFLTLSNRPGGGIVKGVEFHWQMVGADYNGYRPITAYAPWTGTDAKYDSSISYQGAYHDFKDGDGNSVISFSFRGPASDTRAVSLGAKVVFYHAGNNVPWLRQYNAAGNGFLNHAYFNSRDMSQEDYATEGNISTWQTNALGIYSAWARSCGSTPNGARLHYLGAGGGSLATCTAYEADITASTVAINVLRNNHTSGEARQKIETIGTGNAILQFSRTFAEANITWNGTTVAFDKPIKNPGTTVSGAGSAATAGAGTQFYVTDLNATTTGSVAAGGGTNKGFIISDGTDWRIVAAWA